MGWMILALVIALLVVFEIAFRIDRAKKNKKGNR